ncbi:hypothetical protein R1flu_010288 [Riccia fluitans]|uniref:DUF4283 domain-containing protein n=1 Tax=Riccia fluitans TaxID=41844 RepID=A0ABD1Z4J2_9MARC
MKTSMESDGQQVERLFKGLSAPDGPPSQYRIQRSLRQGIAAMTTLLNMGLVAIFPSNPPLLDRYKEWTLGHWEKRMRLSVLHSRFLGRSVFLTVFDNRKRRNRALGRHPPTINNNTAKLLPWTPQCEQEGVSLTTQLMWVELPRISSLYAEWVPDLFQQLGPVIQMPSTSFTLTYEDARAQILWDTKNEFPSFVEIELTDEDGRPPIVLRQEVRFLEPGKCRKCHQAFHGRRSCRPNPTDQGHKRKAQDQLPTEAPPDHGKRNFWNPERLADFQRSQAAETSSQRGLSKPPTALQSLQTQMKPTNSSHPHTKWVQKPEVLNTLRIPSLPWILP